VFKVLCAYFAKPGFSGRISLALCRPTTFLFMLVKVILIFSFGFFSLGK